MNKPAVIKITDTLSQQAICSSLGVGQHAVRYARTGGAFPASWYAVIKSMCEAEGIECPLDAFNWKGQPVPTLPPAPPTAEDAA